MKSKAFKEFVIALQIVLLSVHIQKFNTHIAS